MVKCGIRCSHEQIYCSQNEICHVKSNNTWWPAAVRIPNKWGLWPQYDAESSYSVAPFLNDRLCKPAKCIHVVRRPISVISSWMHCARIDPELVGSFAFFDMFLKIGLSINDPTMCAYTYVAWNNLIECNRPDSVRVHVEDAQGLCDAVGVDLPGEEVPRSNKHRTEPDMGFDDFDKPVRDMLCRVTEKYGYDM